MGSHREWNQQIRDQKRQKKCLLKALSMDAQEKRVAKAEPRPKPTLMPTVSIPSRERKPGTYSQGCFELSNFMIRLLGHDESVPREDDGSVRFDDLAFFILITSGWVDEYEEDGLSSKFAFLPSGHESSFGYGPVVT